MWPLRAAIHLWTAVQPGITAATMYLETTGGSDKTVDNSASFIIGADYFTFVSTTKDYSIRVRFLTWRDDDVPVRRTTAIAVVMAPALALLLVAGGGTSVAPVLPAPEFTVTKYAGNPIISVADDPSEAVEQYVPAPFRVPNGDIWVYVKGQRDIYAWQSTDGGETFTLVNGGVPVIENEVGQWDSQFALEPSGFIEDDIIHLYYKGTNDSGAQDDWSWGHATAPVSDPTDVTKDAGNPIATPADVIADIGGTSIEDLAISDVVKLGSTYHYYGYVLLDNRYQLIQATGTDVDNPDGFESILLAQSDLHVVTSPSVFKLTGSAYIMFYTQGTFSVSNDSSRVKAAVSQDAVNWTFDLATIIEGTPSTWDEDRAYAAAVLKQGSSPEPFLVDGDLVLYYSGQNSGVADTGLAYLTP